MSEQVVVAALLDDRWMEVSSRAKHVAAAAARGAAPKLTKAEAAEVGAAVLEAAAGTLMLDWGLRQGAIVEAVDQALYEELQAVKEQLVAARKNRNREGQQRASKRKSHDTYTTSQVADILQVSPKTVSRWAKEGKLPFIKTLGGHRRYPQDAVDALRKELEQLLAADAEAARERDEATRTASQSQVRPRRQPKAKATAE